MIARIASRLLSLIGAGERRDESPAVTTTQDVLGDLLGGVGPDAPGYQGNARTSVAPPIAPRRGDADLARIEAEPSQPMHDADTDTGAMEVPVRRSPGKTTSKPEPQGWNELDFGGSA